jgi:hypothetical protein
LFWWSLFEEKIVKEVQAQHDWKVFAGLAEEGV